MDRYRKFLVTACLAVLIAVTAESSPNLRLGFATCVGADPCHACSSLPILQTLR